MDCTGVHPSAFTYSVVMRAPSNISGRETFLRSVKKLIRRGCFSSRAEVFESLQYLSTSVEDAPAGECALSEPTWSSVGQEIGLSDVDCRQLIDRASKVVQDASGVLARGDVTFQRRLPPSAHPWVRYDARLRERRAVYRGAHAA